MKNLGGPEPVPNSSAFAIIAATPRLALKDLELLKVSSRPCLKPSSVYKQAN